MSVPSATDEMPCDTLSDQLAFRAARRKLRYRNAARKGWSPCFALPPGLTSRSQQSVVELYDLVMVLSERLRRVELLLIASPLEDFKFK